MGTRRDVSVQVGDGRVPSLQGDTLRLRISPGRESLLYQEIIEMDDEDGSKEGCLKRRRRLDSPPPLPPPRPQRPRVERRWKNLFRHLGLEGLHLVGEEHLLRLTLNEGEEGGGGYGGASPGHHHLVGPHHHSSSWSPPSEDVRFRRRKDLAKFLGVEEVPGTMERLKGRSLDSSSSDWYSIPSYSGTSNFTTSSSSSRTP